MKIRFANLMKNRKAIFDLFQIFDLKYDLLKIYDFQCS